MVRIRLPLPLKNRIRLLCGFLFRPVGQAVKTSPFHGGIMGSIPVRVTISIARIWLNKAFCGLFFLPKNRRWVLLGYYFFQAPLFLKSSTSATALQALTWFSRNICPYMFSEVLTCECPRIPETVVGSMPAPISKLA